jgi:hypothetical protein
LLKFGASFSAETPVEQMSSIVFDLDLSPDDAQVVFSDRSSIQIMNLATRETREIAKGSRPAWQPDVQ